jgi:hypothetical protein
LVYPIRVDEALIRRVGEFAEILLGILGVLCASALKRQVLLNINTVEGDYQKGG